MCKAENRGLGGNLYTELQGLKSLLLPHSQEQAARNTCVLEINEKIIP